MRKVWLHAVRAYIKVGLFFYFKKIESKNKSHVPLTDPVMLLSNHQNALLDALLIATKSKRFVFFLTRASVFNKPIIAKLLMSLNMIPVYRVRDGWGSISKNKAVFDSCSKFLKQGEVVALFPEGNHNLKRTVRPLSKGFTRIVDETLTAYPKLNLKLLPIGLNYKKPLQYPDSVLLNYGKPLDAITFVEKNELDIPNLRIRIQDEISKLTTHIPSENYDEDLAKLKSMNMDFLKPERVNSCIANGFETEDHASHAQWNGFQSFFKVLLICSLFLPYSIWKLWVKPKIKEIEFVDTFRFAVAITIVPVYLIISAILVSCIFSFEIALLYFLSILLLAICSAKL